MMRYNGAGSGPMPPSSWRPSTASEAWPGERAKVMAVRASAATRCILVVHPPRDFPMAWGPFFLRAHAIGMHLDGGRVQFDGLALEAHDLLPLQLFKDAIQHAVLGPAVHASVDGVPVAKTFRQAAPLAPLPGHVQQRVEHLQG